MGWLLLFYHTGCCVSIAALPQSQCPSQLWGPAFKDLHRHETGPPGGRLKARQGFGRSTQPSLAVPRIKECMAWQLQTDCSQLSFRPRTVGNAALRWRCAGAFNPSASPMTSSMGSLPWILIVHQLFHVCVMWDRIWQLQDVFHQQPWWVVQYNLN